MARAVSCLLLAAGAAGHATMVVPLPRASGGTLSAPSFPGAKSYPGCAGDACLWYSVGCFSGCPACSSTGKSMYPTPADNGEDGHGGPCKTPIEPTNNAKAARTINADGKSKHGDWTKYMPWRAPGSAPSVDPCGVAGAFKPSAPNNALVPHGHKQYQKGTSLPALAGNKTVWKAGATIDVAWAIAANHGGGYQYRVCPKTSGVPTEACFQMHALPFVGGKTTIHYTDGKRADFDIPAVDVTSGTKPAGSAWRKNPIPMCNCDVGEACRPGVPDSGKYPAGMFEPYAQDPRAKQQTPQCPTGVQYPPMWDEGYGAGDASCLSMGSTKPCSPWRWLMVDKVRAPTAAGDYTLSFRWDCEHTPQVWNQCADITVA